MAADTQETHRAGAFKQQNKHHKHGKHKSKGQLEKDVKGRVNVKSLSKKSLSVQRKNDRRYQAQQLRKQKRDDVMNKKRSVGSSGSPPHCVAVVALHSTADVKSVVQTITSCDETAVTTETGSGIAHMSIPRFKQRIALLPVVYGDLYSTLDAVKVADSLLLVVSAEGGVDEFGDYCLSCLLGQGLPAVTIAVQGLKDLPQKKQKEVRKQLQKRVDKWFPEDKLHSLDCPQDGLLVLRHMTEQKLKSVHYRENRPHLLAERVQFDIGDDYECGGVLKLDGYIRSQTLCVNRLVHIPGLGDYQLSQVDILDDPHPLNNKTSKSRHKPGNDVEMSSSEPGCDVISVEYPDPTRQESLVSEVIPDPMDAEQTWPTEDELAEAAESSSKKIVRRVPKGTSSYQASWIIDEHTEEDDDASQADDDDVDNDMEAMEDDDSDNDNDDDDGDDSEEDDQEEYEDVTIQEDDDTKYDQQIDMQEEMAMLEKIKEEKMHVMFPDEVDTPKDVSARTRFQKYRGLKSFRTSPWDPKENLPLDYARVFQFGNFRRTVKKVLGAEHDELEGGIPVWSYVRLHVKDVPKSFMDNYKPSSPVVVFGLLPHEQKMSVVNLAIRKCTEVTRPIKSKERLVFHCGFRRYSTCPVFSQHTNGKRHKFERFLPEDTSTVATMFAPITFPPSPVLVFQDRPFGGIELVAKGSLLSIDPDRIVAKRAVVSGYPFKINKKSCVVRYMFFNREDIMWFKPVELRTKWGRRGHIKEPLGTHGHMKCIFDGQLKSQDSILMNLYKRVFPKWTYCGHLNKPLTVTRSVPVTMDTIEEEKEGAAFAMFD